MTAVSADWLWRLCDSRRGVFCLFPQKEGRESMPPGIPDRQARRSDRFGGDDAAMHNFGFWFSR